MVRWGVSERASDRDGGEGRVWREDRERKGGKEEREGGDGSMDRTIEDARDGGRGLNL